jgi:hypothetical protein
MAPADSLLLLLLLLPRVTVVLWLALLPLLVRQAAHECMHACVGFCLASMWLQLLRQQGWRGRLPELHVLRKEVVDPRPKEHPPKLGLWWFRV